MSNRLMQIVFLSLFALTWCVTLLALTQVVPMADAYLKGLFGALILESIGIVLSAARTSFGGSKAFEKYKWTIVYPSDLKSRFETPYLKDSSFSDFYLKYKGVRLSEIKPGDIAEGQLQDFLDTLFILKKAGEFAGRMAEGDLFLIMNGKTNSNDGWAVLTFPNEVQPIAFVVSGRAKQDGAWYLRFEQPDRYVDFEGRINRWKGGGLEVAFASPQEGQWVGELRYDNVAVGRFELIKEA